MALHHGRFIRLWCCPISTTERVNVDRDLDAAAIYELGQNGTTTFVPIMATNEFSRQLAYEWAGTLVRLSGKPVAVYRNGAHQITLGTNQ